METQPVEPAGEEPTVVAPTPAEFTFDVDVIDRVTRESVGDVQLGFVRADGRTAYARHEGARGTIRCAPRDGDTVFVYAEGYELLRLPVERLGTQRSVELTPCVERVVIALPSGLSPDATLRIAGGIANDGKWGLEDRALRWSSPIRRNIEIERATLPREFLLSPGLVLRCCLYKDGVEFAPPTIKVRSGDTGCSTAICTRRLVIDTGALPGAPDVQDLVLIPDCLETPALDGMLVDALVTRMVAPDIGRRCEGARNEWNEVPPFAVHAYVRVDGRLYHRRIAAGSHDVQLEVDVSEPQFVLPTVTEAVSRRGSVFVLPGRLDVSAALLLLARARRTGTPWVREVPESDGTAVALGVSGVEAVTLWNEALGLCHVTESGATVDLDDWYRGGIVVRAPAGQLLTGRVLVMADWHRPGQMIAHSDERSLARRPDGEEAAVFSGLAPGWYLVEATGRTEGPEGGKEHRLLRHVEVRGPEDVATLTLPQ